MLSLVTTIHKLDDLKTFENALESGSFADEIIIYAMGMKKNQELEKLAKKYSAIIKPTKIPQVVEAIRQQQVKQTQNDWVFILDFDEEITPALKKKIQSITKQSSPKFGGYKILRRNYSLGYSLRFGGWGDDYQLRLIHKDFFQSWPKTIHAFPKIKGKVGKIEKPLLHHKDQSLSIMVKKTNRYSEKEATQFYKGGLPKVTQFTLLRKLCMESFRRGFLKLGLLDGAIGIIQTMYQGFSVFITYAKLYEKQIQQKKE